MHKVITMCDNGYFQYGKLFIQTRKKIDADFILYGPNLDSGQIHILTKNNIEYKKMDKRDFNLKMQYMKFKLLFDNITGATEDNITFVDFDTLFLNDWNNYISGKQFDLGITYNNLFIKQKVYRSFANGGVIFVKDTFGSVNMCAYARHTMNIGNSKFLPEYDSIYKTLEDHNRPEHKRYSRTYLRWWCDQVFLSAIILQYLNTHSKLIMDDCAYKFHKHNIQFFDCSKFNNLNVTSENITIRIMKHNPYICHLKNIGRSGSYEKIIKRLL